MNRSWYVLSVALIVSASSMVARGQETKPAANPSTASASVASASATDADKAKADPSNMLKPTAKVDSWRFEQAEGGKGEVSAEGEWLQVKVSKSTGTDWHVQVVQADLDLKEGKSYTLSFEVKSDVRRNVVVSAMIDKEDWHEIGLHEEIYLGTEPRKEEFTFTASGVAEKKNRISIACGTDKGSVFLKNVRLVEAK